MRAAEAYLIYAEADARMNGGTTTTDGAQVYQRRTVVVRTLPLIPLILCVRSVMNGAVSSTSRVSVAQHSYVSVTLEVMLTITGVGRVA